MTILNPEFGHQEGWVELDEETFFIDASILPFGFYDQLFQITRPPAIPAFGPCEPCPSKDKEMAIYSYTIMNHEKLDESIPRDTMEYSGLGL
jgi:hypothetical protein